jgi:hypothetical protein
MTPTCASLPDTVSLAQPGGTRRNVSGSANLPGTERGRGQEHAGKAGTEDQTRKSVSRKTRVAWQKLHCLKSSPTRFSRRPAGARQKDGDFSLRTACVGGRCPRRGQPQPPRGRGASKGLVQRTNGLPKRRSDVSYRGSKGSPTGREPYGDGAPIVVCGRESRPPGKGGQVIGRPVHRGTRDAKRRRCSERHP